MSTTNPAKWMKIGEFLARRLEEAGVEQVFGVPGDYSLSIAHLIEHRGSPKWIGTCNELNGSYAADAYARLKGLGALFVTHGVGALSAFNGIAGAYSEHVPVVLVAGSLPLKWVHRGAKLHHSLCDEGQNNYFRAFSEITVAQAQLTQSNAASEIDRLILTAWREKRPVYLELPSDIAYLDIEVPVEPLELTYTPSDPERLASCAETIVQRLSSAKAPALLLDEDAQRYAIEDDLARLAEHWQLPVATMTSAKGAFSELSPLYAGLYVGAGSLPATRKAIEESDCLLTVGFRRVESTTGYFSDKLPSSAIHLNGAWVDIEDDNFQGINLVELLPKLIDGSPVAPRGTTAFAFPRPAAEIVGDALVTQATFWPMIQELLQPGDVLVVEDGTPLAGALSLQLPANCSVVCAGEIYASIGYATGALLGAIAATPGRRHILFTGDGSFQMTAQEISTVLREGYKPMIFLINNAGYTIERTILGLNDRVNDVANWNYTQLPSAFQRDTKAETAVVTTNDELRAVLAAEHTEFLLVEAVMRKDDAQLDLIANGKDGANQEFGPRGPQNDPGARITAPLGAGGAA